MEHWPKQNTRVETANRAERIRNRALLHVQRTGDFEGYWQLVNLSREVGSIRVVE